MFEMLDAPTRSAVVLSLKGYAEALRLAPNNRMMVAGVFVDCRAELKKIKRLEEMFFNNFVYVSDEVMDREKLYQAGAEKQPQFVQLLQEMLPLVNRANVMDDQLKFMDIAATNRLREIVNALNAGG